MGSSSGYVARLRYPDGGGNFPVSEPTRFSEARLAVDGCKCRDCYGLREYLADHGMDMRGLPAAPGCGARRPVALEAISGEVPHDPRSYTCQCVACRAEIAERMRRVRTKVAA